MEKFEKIQENMVAEENLDQVSGGIVPKAEVIQEFYSFNEKIGKSSYSSSLRKTMDLLQKIVDGNEEKNAK